MGRLGKRGDVDTYELIGAVVAAVVLVILAIFIASGGWDGFVRNIKSLLRFGG